MPGSTAPALHRTTSAAIVADILRRHMPAIRALRIDLSAEMAKDETHVLVSDDQSALFILLWRGPGIWMLAGGFVASAHGLAQVKAAIAYIKAAGCKMLWVADTGTDAAPMLKAFGMKPAGIEADVFGIRYPIFRVGFR